MATQKKSYAARLGVLAVALSLVTACLLGGTMAKYVTEVTGTGSATVAKWSFKANGSDTTLTEVNIANTAYTNVATGKIAPGTAGSFDIALDAKGSEVAVDYAIELSNLGNMPKGLNVYEGANKTSGITVTGGVATLEGSIGKDSVDTPVKKTIYWVWDGADTDADDTVLGKAGEKKTFNIKVTGTQKTPVAPAA